MKRAVASLLTLAIVVFLFAPVRRVYPQSQTTSPRYVPGQLLVKLKAGAADAGEMPEFVARSHGDIEPLLKSEGGDLLLVTLDGESVEAATARLAQDSRIEFAEPNYLWQAAALPNDALFISSMR